MADEKLTNRQENIKALYKAYPVVEKIDMNNKGIIKSEAIFKTVSFGEYLKLASETCQGILFVIKGTINIQKISEDGDETNLYDIRQGEFCHEALSCLSNLDSLKIVAKAVQASQICLIPADLVENYFINDREFLFYMYRDLHNKFNNIIDNKEKIIHESLEARLVKLLIKKDNNVIYTTHSQLAFEIDSVREVVSRKLKDIEKRGYIKLERGKIIILKDLKEILKLYL